MDRWVKRCMGEWTAGWMNAERNERMRKLMDEWGMNKKKDGRADEWLDEWLIINVDEWKEDKRKIYEIWHQWFKTVLRIHDIFVRIRPGPNLITFWRYILFYIIFQR
jgi:hypothetical protein